MGGLCNKMVNPVRNFNCAPHFFNNFFYIKKSSVFYSNEIKNKPSVSNGIKTAFIFPGQGAQYAGMGQDIYAEYETARRVFEEAQAVLDFDLLKVCFEGPQEELSRTDISQPAILTLSVALLRVFQELNPDVTARAMAGLSLGEYSALVACGSISFKDAVGLVRKRGRFMEEAASKNPGKMLSVIGLEQNTVEEICGQTRTQIANLNCPGQIVISGKKEDIEAAAKLAGEKNAKMAVFLDVSGPFHSSFMKEAAVSLERELEKSCLSRASVPVVSNVNACYETEPADIRKNLVAQVSHTVRWQNSMELLINDGFEKFFEIGPKKVLKGLMRHINPEVTVINIETAEDLKLRTKD